MADTRTREVGLTPAPLNFEYC